MHNMVLIPIAIAINLQINNFSSDNIINQYSFLISGIAILYITLLQIISFMKIFIT